MGKNTHISAVLDIAGNKAQYDAQAKLILSDKTILAWILKYTAMEFRDYGINQIQECIEGEPEIAQVPVYPGKKPDAIIGMSTESKLPNEGEVTFDIRFHAVTPDARRIKLILNVEAQKNYHPGYDLVTRAIFYCARMLSAQLDTEFTTDHYDDIKKVYSIWICMNTPAYAHNTITEYAIQKNAVFGNFQGTARYDLLSAVMVCLGNGQKGLKSTPLHGLLTTLFSNVLQPAEKAEILSGQYGIHSTSQIKEGIQQMCNLSDLIEERGIEQGIEQGRLEAFYSLVHDGLLSSDEAAKRAGMSVEEFQSAMAEAGY